MIKLQHGETEPTPYNLQENTGHFHTKKKPGDTTALSSFDSEHTSVAECIKIVILIRGVVGELIKCIYYLRRYLEFSYQDYFHLIFSFF